MDHTRKNSGFTLIETIVYIALLGLVMTGVVTTSYDLIWSSQASLGKTTVQEEGSFLQRKLEWALADMSAAPTTGGSGCNQTLAVTKTGYLQNPIEFRRNSANNSVEMREGGTGAYSPLTTSNVSLSCLTFTPIAAVGTAPPGVGALATINSFTFAITKYVRK